ncbi:probable ATP-dependent RNA helicase DDX20 [Lepisosteus oculatus]|uniref:probable ATP-dependent RNA helicase DDX20 n=1 Tax=Lepisosteus oculatus TaxID=7918 RepID=UPI00371DACF5
MAASMKKAAHDIQTRRRTEDVLLAEGIDFSSLLLSQPVLDGLAAAGFQKPSPIQLKAIPLGRCGLDLIVQAKSGTGKTCVFSTIALDSLILKNVSTQVLVLAPTREIAVQIHSVVTTVGAAMEGLECHVFIGGTPVSLDKSRLKKCHIAVGSPGRIKQLIEMGYLSTASIRLFVLDEADKLLEEGSFQDQINWIYSSLPVNKQMLALSATYPESLAQHLKQYMRDPTFVRLNPMDPALIGLKQFYKVVSSHPLAHKIFEEKVQHLFELFSKIPFNQALVFSNLHSRAQHLADILTSKGLPAVCISGSLSQDQRLEAMAQLKQYQCRVLISTDLTSRGIDAEKVNLVINLDVPQEWETYMHRIGRAGRFGTQGLAVTYCCRGEEENKMMAIAQKCNLSLSCLPDPIPPGLMEEPSDWDITIENFKTAPSLRTLSKGENKMVEKPKDAMPFSSRRTERPKPKPLAKTVPAGHSGIGRGVDVVNVKDPKKPAGVPVQEKAPNVPLSTYTATLHAAQKTDSHIQEQRALQESLPKISPLPSFKAEAWLPLSFEEIEADYESFMIHGPGRSVEIIRQYRGPNSDMPGQQVETKELEIPPNAGPSELVKDCMSERDDHNSTPRAASPRSSSSSEVSTDTDTDGYLSPEEEGGVLASPGKVVGTGSAELNLQRSPRFSPECPDSPRSYPRALLKHRAPAAPCVARPLKKKGFDPNRSFSKKAHGVKQQEGVSFQKPRNKPQIQAQSHQQYWQTYYQAWEEYYAAMAHPHHRHYQMASSWMAAYRMNSVYVEELLKR